MNGQEKTLTNLRVNAGAQIGSDTTVALTSAKHEVILEFDTITNVESIKLEVTKTNAANNNLVLNEIRLPGYLGKIIFFLSGK